MHSLWCVCVCDFELFKELGKIRLIPMYDTGEPHNIHISSTSSKYQPLMPIVV